VCEGQHCPKCEAIEALLAFGPVAPTLEIKHIPFVANTYEFIEDGGDDAIAE
jgi:hypothetical protein